MFVPSDWHSEAEDMGSKIKFWCHPPDDPQSRWLFKFPKPLTGEHWAEKIAEQICSIMGIEHARVELAEYSVGMESKTKVQRGSITKSFVRENSYLLHGNQILKFIIDHYDTQKTYKQTNHTLKNILNSMREFTAVEDELFAAQRKFAEYLVLDALIGNTDRHDENWGLLAPRYEDSNIRYQLAPSFDHASSLGRELRDAKRRQLLSSNHVANYSKKGRGAIFWAEDDARCKNPIQLINLALSSPEYQEAFRLALDNIDKVNVKLVQSVISRVPESWMSITAREFAVELMEYNLKELDKLKQ